MNDKDLIERLIVQENMIRHGGSFVKNLGYALSRADPDNTKIIKKSFQEYWNKYKKVKIW